MDAGEELFFEAEDIAPGLNRISVAGVKRASHVAQQGMGDLVNRGHQQSLNRTLLFRGQWPQPIPLAR